MLSLAFVLTWALPAIASGPSHLKCDSIQSSILGRSVGYCVALPENYESAGATRYPALYFLHGLFEDQESWAERGGKQVLDDLLQQDQIGPFIVVLPNGGKTFYINSFDGHERYEDFFIQEFVPAIDRLYRTIPSRAERAISGSSMGGYGSLHLGMRHPDLFDSASAHSAALIAQIPNPLPTEGRWQFYSRVLQEPFGSPLNEGYFEANSPLNLAQHPDRFSNLRIYFDCGDHDRYGFEEGAALLDRILNEHNFPHEFVLRPGGHGWNYLEQYLKYSILLHWRLFEKGLASGSASGKKAAGK